MMVQKSLFASEEYFGTKKLQEEELLTPKGRKNYANNDLNVEFIYGIHDIIPLTQVHICQISANQH